MGNKSLDKALTQGLSFFVENKKVIQSVNKIYSYNEKPKLYQYACTFRDKHSKDLNSNSVASGTAFNKKRALVKLFGETIERYALSSNDNITILKSYNELVKERKNALNPQYLIHFTDNKKYTSKTLSDKIHWVKGRSLSANNEVFIPAQLVYVPFIHYEDDALIQLPLSTGAASGISLNDALFRGIFEVIERDSFMIHYLNKFNSHRINLGTIKNSQISKIVEMMKMYNLELHCMDLTTDLEINSIAALVIDRSGLGPSVSVGLKAGIDQAQNLIGAIEEALMVRSWVRDDYSHLGLRTSKKKKITTIEERAKFWFPQHAIDYLSFWTKGRSVRQPKSIKNTKGITLETVVNCLLNKNVEIYYVDITTKEVEKCGFKVVKVIIPSLQPLYLNEKYPYVYSNRLYEAPISMGVLKKKRDINDLNKIPHPFL